MMQHGVRAPKRQRSCLQCVNPGAMQSSHFQQEQSLQYGVE